MHENISFFFNLLYFYAQFLSIFLFPPSLHYIFIISGEEDARNNKLTESGHTRLYLSRN